MEKKIIKTQNAPAAVGPYSQAVVCDNFVFCSGQLGMEPSTGLHFPSQKCTKIEGDVRKQTEQCLKNLTAVLKEAGTDLSHALKVTVYLKDMNKFAEMNEVYSSFFPENPPARTCIEAARLPKNAMVEIDIIANLPG
ncbi:MAG: RidA family protein [Planctomycetota bacterium]